MGKIQSISKWSLENNCWIDSSVDNKHRSFSVASYEPIINNSFRDVNYVIIAYGNRVEDLSKDSYNIRNTKVNMNKIIKYFSRDGMCNYIIKYFMLDADAPIKEEAKMIAHFIDERASLSNTLSINVIGLSKCGAMNIYIPSFFDNPDSFKCTNIYNVATPYNGTISASPLIFYPKIKELVISKFGDNKFSNTVYENLINYYESISSNSHMDYDIARINGITDDMLDRYDRSFIENIFSSENINALKKINNFYNYTTHIDEGVLSKAVQNGDFASIGLCLMDKWFFEEPSDGLVQTSDQYLIECCLNTKSVDLISTHNIAHSKEYYKVLSKITENAYKANDKKRRRYLY